MSFNYASTLIIFNNNLTPLTEEVQDLQLQSEEFFPFCFANISHEKRD